jgi:hypothetical protein
VTNDKRENTMSLVGKFYVDHMGDRFRTGEVIEQIQEGVYLCRADWMRDTDGYPTRAMAVVHVTRMLNHPSSPLYFEFYDTREERDAYVRWMESPPPPKEPAKVTKLNPRLN